MTIFVLQAVPAHQSDAQLWHMMRGFEITLFTIMRRVTGGTMPDEGVLMSSLFSTY